MSSEKDTPNTEDPVLEKSPSRWFVNPRGAVSPTKPLLPQSSLAFCLTEVP
jgi:hypothetical protein